MGDNTGKRVPVSPPSLFRALIDWDVDVTRRMAVCATPQSQFGQWRPLMRFLEYSAHGVPWLIFNVVAILATHRIDLHQILFNLFYALILDLVIVTLLKAIFRRPRPAHNTTGDMMTISVDLFSFPSGHTTRAIMVAYFSVVHYSGGPLVDLLVLLWGVAVSLSRILLGRHHVLDVSVGAVIGVLQYRLLANYLWLSKETCEAWIRPIQEELHI